MLRCHKAQTLPIVIVRMARIERELPGKISRGGHGDHDEANESGDAGDFWGDGEQTSVGAGRALIDVGSIELQRRNGQLETEARDNEHQCQRRERRKGSGGRQRGKRLANARMTGGAGDERRLPRP